MSTKLDMGTIMPRGSHNYAGVYVFLCKGVPLYCGQSNDVGRRVRTHRTSIRKFGCTSSGKPVKLTDSYNEEDWTIVLYKCASREYIEFKMHLKHETLLSSAKQGKSKYGYMFIAPNGTETFVWNSLETCKELGLCYRAVSGVLLGKCKHHKSYKFRYATKEEAIKATGVH